MTAVYVLLALVAALLLWAVAIYNRFIRRRAMVREGWSGIDVQLKRRHDLIPNLIETVKGYKTHEQKVLNEVTRLRSAAAGASGPEARGRLEGKLGGALANIFAVAEAYPELKANTVFLDLQEQLSGIEEHLQLARRYYNGTVRNFNILVGSVPSNIIAGMFDFTRAEFFELEDPSDRAVPEVKF